MAASSTPKPPTNPSAMDKIFTSQADSTVSHLVRVLSTAAGIDSTLLLTGYSLTLFSAQLQRILDLNLRQTAEKLAAAAANSTAAAQLKPGETLVATQPVAFHSAAARLADVVHGTKTFAGMCSDVRMFMRLWGLLKLWAGAKAAYYHPHPDTLVNITTWGKMASMLAYLAVENNMYLGMKGVLKGWTPERLGKAFRVSVYAFGVYLALDFVALARKWQLQERTPAAADEKEAKVARQAEDGAWWRALQVDLAYTPLSFHWAAPGGLMGDSSVGLLGAWAGYVGFREAWRITA